jgi:hypothetical protein
MQPIRQVIAQAPATVAIPENLRNKPIELIIWPLNEEAPEAIAKTDMDEAFGLWGRRNPSVDGLEYQELLCSEPSRPE